MTVSKQNLYDFTSSLLDGNEMETTLFSHFLDVAQAYWEGQRPWVVLRTEDSSNTATTSDTFETEHSLPSDFRKWYTKFSIVLTDGSGNVVQYLSEISLHLKNQYKNDPTKFYCNYRTKKFYLCGTVTQSYTIRIYYIQKTTKVSLDDDNTWDLDPNDEYTRILAFSVAVYYKRGVDYDIVNNTQADQNALNANQVFNLMTDWDAELQESSLPLEYAGGPGGNQSALGGSIRNLL